jgi:biotin transport system permease protein
LLVLFALANFVTVTSKLSDMIEFFLWILHPLKLIGVKTSSIGLALGMVIRFTPVLIERAKQLLESWRARALKRTNWRIILPIFITVIDDADRVAEAIRARGGI